MRLLVVALIMLFAAVALAQEPTPTAAPTAAPTASPSASASAAPTGSASALPPGHPPTAAPPGHPSAPGIQRPQDAVLVNPELPAGTIDVQINDARGNPVPNATIELAILFSSVTEGEKRDTKVVETDEVGRFRFTDMQFGTGTSYRLTTKVEEAMFGSQPFGLKDSGGVQVILHVFEPVRKLEDAAFVMEAVVLMEVKEDSIAVNHLLRTLNIGSAAFVPQNVGMPLPQGYKAFTTQEPGSGHGVVERDGQLFLEGTFPPGEAEMTFRYMVPMSGDAAMQFRLALPPRVISTRVVIGAGTGMTMSVSGFPPAQSGRWRDGKRILETGKKADVRMGLQALMTSTEPMLFDVKLGGLPVPGPGRMIALMLAALSVCGGFYYMYWSRLTGGTRRDQREDLLEAQAALLAEIATLAKAHHKGDVGPRTYERLHNALLDALARIVTRLEAVAPKKKRKGKAPAKPLMKKRAPAKKATLDEPEEERPSRKGKKRKRKRKRARA